MRSAMRRALNVLGIIALTTLITYLWMSKNLAEERVARLDHALVNAEARVSSLEADIESTSQQLEELRRNQESRSQAFSSSRQARTVISTLRSNQSEADGAMMSASSRADTTGPAAPNSMEGAPG